MPARPQPQDHKRPAAKKSAAAADNTDVAFDYTTPAGAEIQLPAASALPVGLLRRIRKLNEFDQNMTILEETCSKDVLEAVDEMNVAQLNEMFAEWNAHNGVTLGK